MSKFVTSNILPGAVAEVGLLCCACVHSNPNDAVVQLVKPILESILSSLEATPTTGFGMGVSSNFASTKVSPVNSLTDQVPLEYYINL